ncbi:MAG: 30S ribosomal protein S17 [Holosporales bacterium]|jgi:small subunit ribosomal protein S17|nr:30S ribosomal protein S17 [Holosporales bacterium]
MPKRILSGIVVSNVCDKTVTVNVTRQVKHPRYMKYVRISKKYLAHDSANACKIGEVVSIQESRPISKRKSWIVLGESGGGQ